MILYAIAISSLLKLQSNIFAKWSLGPRTPDSQSVLDSVTNSCLEKLAADMGLTVERRRIDFDAEVATWHARF